MPCPHFDVKIIQRSKRQSAVASAAYQSGEFTTIQVAGRMRVMLDSFEDWYAGQFHYKKVDGTPPGAKWRHTTMSVPELAELLGLKSATAYDLVKRAHLETMIIDRRTSFQNYR